MSHLRILRFDQECRLIQHPNVSTAVLPACHVARPSDRADHYMRTTEARTAAATALLLRELKRHQPRFYGVALVRCPGRHVHGLATEPLQSLLRAYLISFAVLGPRNTIVHGDTSARTLSLAMHYTQRYLASVRAGQPDEQLLARM